MTVFWIIIFSIIGWQLICTVADLITYLLDKDNEQFVRFLALGICGLLATLLYKIYELIKLKIFCRKYNCYQLFGDISEQSPNRAFNGWVGNYYMTKKVADKYFVRQVSRNEEIKENYTIRLLRFGQEFKSAPVKSEILTAKKIEKGITGLSPKFLEKFRK